MNGYIDLHTHSTASDGSLTPKELVRHARSRGLSVIALTDHDTVDGIGEALDEGNRIGLKVIPGIEISVDYSPEMHILGYFPRDAYNGMDNILTKLRRSRDERNPKIIRKLNEMGFEITMEEVQREAEGMIVGRPHIAKVLMDKGYVGSTAEAFNRYLSHGRPAFFKKDKLTPSEGIRAISEVGGIAVLAHPIFLFLGAVRLDELLGEMAASGLKGVEVYYAENSDEDTVSLKRLAEKHKLIATGGSDYHGSFKPDLEIGTGHGNLKVPYDAVVMIEEELCKKNPR